VFLPIQQARSPVKSFAAQLKIAFRQFLLNMEKVVFLSVAKTVIGLLLL